MRTNGHNEFGHHELDSFLNEKTVRNYGLGTTIRTSILNCLGKPKVIVESRTPFI